MRAGLFLVLGLLLPLLSWAQEGQPEASQIPRQLFVGDRGRLILNLESPFPGTASFAITEPWFLPQSPELRLHRLEFDSRRGQVLVDFTAFAPGELEIPPIEIPQLPGFNLEGCRVSIASVLNPGSSPQDGGVLVLSGSAPPLAVPGTALLIYGSSSLMILGLLLLLGLGIWGRPYLAKLMEARRRRRLIRLMGNIGESLRERIPRSSCQTILKRLSVEFRAFLGYFFDGESGMDCRAMTAEEFSVLSPLFSPAEGLQPVSPSSLGDFFRRLDRLRFSGETAAGEEISALLDQMEGILRAMERGFKEQGKS
ncbi:MAG: hypothetical protein LBG07_07955 [Treponema sp.]|jgi:hypothetical protein|nr:hypothetical protein [Treponema sp.]